MTIAQKEEGTISIKIDNHDLLEIYSAAITSFSAEVHIWKLVRDSSGNIKTWTLVDANPKALKSWGRELSDIIGKPTEEIFVDSDPVSLFMPVVSKIFGENKPHEWREYFSDTNQILQMTSIPVGEYFVSTGEDITGKIHSEHFIEQAHRLDSLGAIAGGVAHDINNLNSIIRGQASLALKKAYDEKIKSHFEKILDASEKSSELTKLILSFAKNDKVESETVDLKHTIKSILGLISSAEMNIKINFAETNDPFSIFANKVHVNQILLNVINNAVRSMHDTLGELSIVIENVIVADSDIPSNMQSELRVISPGNFVKVRIQDTGNGIQPEALPFIFEPFSSFSRIKKGTGLGLSIVKTLLTEHGGFATVESVVDQGTTFQLHFPIAK